MMTGILPTLVMLLAMLKFKHIVRIILMSSIHLTAGRT